MSDEGMPQARRHDLVVTETGDELMVYDEKAHQLHHLNAMALAVWRACNGERTVTQLVAETGIPEGAVEVALRKLGESNLLETALPPSRDGSGSSRRALLRRAGLAGAALAPAIVSITAPVAAQQTSCLPTGQVCTSNEPGDCCTGMCGPRSTCCTPSGQPCSLGNPGACCSLTCINNVAGPYCA